LLTQNLPAIEAMVHILVPLSPMQVVRNGDSSVQQLWG